MSLTKKLLLPVLALGLAGQALAQKPKQKPKRDTATIQIPASNKPNKPNQTPTTLENPRLVKQYQGLITPDLMASHLYFYASDFFEGRETTAPGQKMAAAWLASQYQRLGLTPKGTTGVSDKRDPRAYFQPFKLIEERLKGLSLSAEVGGKTVSTSYAPTNADGMSALQFGSAMEGQGGLVFAGYGVKEGDKYDDYAALKAANISWAGKWLLMFEGEPSKDGKSLLSADGKPTKWTEQWWSKLSPAYAGGAPLGFLIISNNADFKTEAMQAAMQLSKGVGNLKTSWEEGAGGGGRKIPPIVKVSPAFANQLLAGMNKEVSAIKAGIDGNLKPEVFEVKDVNLKGKVENEKRDAYSENVVAMIEGTDLKDEYVVVSSHLDHVGTSASNGCTEKNGDKICNGADDDGSGTVTVVSIAEAFARAAADGHRPRRSIIFLNVSGEEKGLFGSEFFADQQPVVPLKNIVTNLNIDMVGRFDPTHPDKNDKRYVYIIGSKLISQELHDLNQQVNKAAGTNLTLHERFNSKDDPNRFYARSDHWNFGKHSIPFIFFFTGTHEDYHQVGDEPQKIEYERMADIGRMIFATTWQVANQDKRPSVSGTGFN